MHGFQLIHHELTPKPGQLYSQLNGYCEYCACDNE